MSQAKTINQTKPVSIAGTFDSKAIVGIEFRSGGEAELFDGAATCTNAASKLNAEALGDLLDRSESRLQVVATCVRFSLSQALRQFW